LNQYCYDNVEREFAGCTANGSCALIAFAKMHKLIGLKSKVYIDMREWSGW
jgi:hypothetical protein